MYPVSCLSLFIQSLGAMRVRRARRRELHNVPFTVVHARLTTLDNEWARARSASRSRNARCAETKTLAASLSQRISITVKDNREGERGERRARQSKRTKPHKKRHTQSASFSGAFVLYSRLLVLAGSFIGAHCLYDNSKRHERECNYIVLSFCLRCCRTHLPVAAVASEGSRPKTCSP